MRREQAGEQERQGPRPAGKHAMNIRLSADARRILDTLAAQKGISRTAVIELAVRDYGQAADRADVAVGNRAAIALLEAWRKEPPSDEEERWPEFQAGLEANRGPHQRNPFSE